MENSGLFNSQELPNDHNNTNGMDPNMNQGMSNNTPNNNMMSSDMNQNTQQHPPEKHSGVISFGGGSKKSKETPPEVQELNNHISEIGRRLRIIEERYSNLRRKSQVTDQNMLTIGKNISKETRSVGSQLTSMHHDISEIKDKMDQIRREMKFFSSLDDLRILKRYLEFWQPLDFISRKDAEKLAKEIVEEHRML